MIRRLHGIVLRNGQGYLPAISERSFNHHLQVKRATVYIVGLGLYELYINGKRIGDHVLAPSPTDYRKSVLYNTYDVTNTQMVKM